MSFLDETFETNELSEYFKLISLLHKERPIQYKEQVEEVIKRELDNKKRIERINEIDREIEKELKEAKKSEIDIIHKDKTIQETKRKISSSGLFTFLFLNRKMVLNFAERTETITISFFGIKKNISSMASAVWNEIYDNTKKYLIAPVTQLVQKGWLNFDITSYNLIVAFDKFLKNFIRTGADLIPTNNPSENLKAIEGFIKNYLQVVFVKEYREIIEESIFEFVLTDNRFKANYKNIRRLVKEFLDIEARSLCFFNVLNAVYIISFNRFIRLDELCKNYGVDDINHLKYDLSPRIETEVKDYIKKIEQKFNLAESELFFLKYIEDFNFKSKEDNPMVKLINSVLLYEHINSDIDYDKLVETIKNSTTEKNKNLEINPFSFIKLDLGRYMLKFITGYRIIYKNILTSPIAILVNNNEEKISIFKDNPFENIFISIAESSRELSLLCQNEKITVSNKTYLSFIEKKLLETNEAEKLCLIVESIVSKLYKIAVDIGNVLYKNYKASSLNPNELLEAYKKQKDPIDLESEAPSLIPYSFNEIKVDRYHKGKKIIDVLNEIMYATINITYLLKHEALMERVIKRPELISDSEYYVKIKSKIL